ncbi:MAG: DUF4394 domain-containing protein [Chloroflexota bacterium]|nr:DUF4394 domain-containing protein [Chloroflexota bacterium]
MRTGTKWALLGALALSTMGAAPVSATNDRGDRCDASARNAVSSYSRNDLLVFGLTFNQRLVCFQSSDPRDADQVGPIRGLAGDARLVGIDFRNANGELHGLGDEGGIYITDTSDASADKVDQLTIELSGEHFGVDFNPAADALRVTGDDGQNLRHPFAGPTAGTTVNDGTLKLSGMTGQRSTAARSSASTGRWCAT